MLSLAKTALLCSQFWLQVTLQGLHFPQLWRDPSALQTDLQVTTSLAFQPLQSGHLFSANYTKNTNLWIESEHPSSSTALQRKRLQTAKIHSLELTSSLSWDMHCFNFHFHHRALASLPWVRKARKNTEPCMAPTCHQANATVLGFVRNAHLGNC